MKITISALMLGIAVLLSSVGSRADAGPEAVKAVTEIMFDQYGNAYDPKHTCWAYTYKNAEGESTKYCMRPSQFEIKEEKGVKMLYLIALSAGDINDNPDYNYSQNEPGMMGAFKVGLGGPQGWVYKAFDSTMQMGLNGQCGCADLQLVQLSNTEHAWLYSEGGTWQGITITGYRLLVPIKGKLTDVSNIPQRPEEDPELSYEVSVKPDPAAKGFYPLHVVKQQSGKTVKEFDVAYDPKTQLYSLPEQH